MPTTRLHFPRLLCAASTLLLAGLPSRAATATVTAGRAVTLTVTANGTAPFTYQWFRNGTALTGATAASYALTNFQAAQAGVYSVRVTNQAGSTLSDQATLVFGAVPAITTQPSSRTAVAGSAVTFAVVATGTPAPSYQWQKDGTNIAGATAGSYTLSSVTAASAGTYRVVVANSAGTVTSSGAVLTISGATSAPTFTTQPASQTVTAGGSVTFTAAASGSPAPTFQWRKDGANLAGATSGTYTIANATTANAGTYSVVATNSAGAATSSGAVLTVTAAATSSWQSGDVGSVGVAGATSESNGVVTLKGAGADIWGTADAFRFQSRTLTGDGAITVRVASVGSTHPWAKAGVMFREDIGAGAREVMAFVTPGNHSSLQYRLAPGTLTTQGTDTSASVPVWLMLVRSGNSFGGYKSANGIDWTPLGTVSCAMPATIYVGLAVSSHDVTRTNTATFDNLEVESVGAAAGSPPVAPASLTASGASSTTVNLSWSDLSADETGFVIERAVGAAGTFAQVGTTGANTSSYVDTGLTANTTYNYRVRARRDATYSAYSNTALITTTSAAPPPVAWTQTALGAGTGSFTGAGASMTVAATGADIWGQFDEGFYVNRAWTGDGEIIVRVDSLANSHAWAKAGVMFRESVAATARNVFVGLTPANGVTLQVRTTSSGVTSEVRSSRTPRPPTWLRLTRAGNNFTASYSSNGTAWTSLGSQTLALPATIYVGVAVSSHSRTVATTAVLSNVQVR
ncbi:MAG TPA: immunoglobulin domain-containing protein [Lacunisphaera sp.]|nr:immunoglobulin domain-containing protein [Lacunisphaera sp.]